MFGIGEARVDLSQRGLDRRAVQAAIGEWAVQICRSRPQDIFYFDIGIYRDHRIG